MSNICHCFIKYFYNYSDLCFQCLKLNEYDSDPCFKHPKDCPDGLSMGIWEKLIFKGDIFDNFDSVDKLNRTYLISTGKLNRTYLL